MPPKTHTMSLQSPHFENVKAGKKTVELRLNDAKRRGLAVGDHIVFSVSDGVVNDTVHAVITALTHAPSFAQLLDVLPLTVLGQDSKDAVLTAVHGFYSEEDEAAFGVVGIHLALENK